jgi:hypothetical protein
MALSAAYFVGELLIPNISGTTTTEQANLLALQIAIAQHEPVFLELLLGYDLYTAYAAGIAAPSPDARWEALDEKIYVENSTLDIGFSPAAGYVYFHFQRTNATATLAGGEGSSAHENFTAQSNAPKQIQAWNEMVRLSELLQEWLDDNADTYPEWSTSEHHIFERINSFGI